MQEEDGMKPRSAVKLSVAGVVALAVTLVTLSAASAGPRGPKVAPLLVVGIPVPQVSTLDPVIQGSQGSYVDAFSLEFLLKLDPSGHVKPNLATSVSQPTPTTYV